jgi:GIY-YIG catalytic domain/NUMOD3 motif
MVEHKLSIVNTYNMHYYLYEIRNLLNVKIYIGVHKTEDLEDGYMGSGSLLKKAIEKHGIENFKKTILETFSSQDEMLKREREVVNESFLLREDVYNLKLGGEGGFDWINSSNIPKMKGKKHSEETKKAISETMSGRSCDHSWIKNRTDSLQEESFKTMCSKGGKALKGSSKSPEHKARIAAAVKERLEKDPELRQKHRDSIKLYHEKKRKAKENT